MENLNRLINIKLLVLSVKFHRTFNRRMMGQWGILPKYLWLWEFRVCYSSLSCKQIVSSITENIKATNPRMLGRANSCSSSREILSKCIVKCKDKRQWETPGHNSCTCVYLRLRGYSTVTPNLDWFNFRRTCFDVGRRKFSSSHEANWLTGLCWIDKNMLIFLYAVLSTQLNKAVGHSPKKISTTIHYWNEIIKHSMHKF